MRQNPGEIHGKTAAFPPPHSPANRPATKKGKKKTPQMKQWATIAALHGMNGVLAGCQAYMPSTLGWGAHLRRLIPIALAVAFLQQSALSNATDLSCDSAVECNKLGTISYKKSRFKEASQYFEQQVMFAELIGKSSASLTAYNNAAMAEFKSGKCLRALAWLRVAHTHIQQLKIEDRATTHNLLTIQKSCSQSPQRPSIDGTYLRYSGQNVWEGVHVSSHPGDRVEYSLTLCHVVPGKHVGCQAEVTGSGLMKGHEARVQYESEEGKTCDLLLSFYPYHLQIQQPKSEGECSIGGAGVYVDGEYWRTDDVAP